MARGSGFASYDGITDAQYQDACLVPLVLASERNMQEYGRVVRSFDDEEVWITTWPQGGWRPICEGTGNQGGVTSGRFTCGWHADLAQATNEAVGGEYVIGRLPPGVTPDDRTHIITREANYHPDGGQVFYPLNQNAFILVLALPGDDVKPEDFVAFYFDGSFGFQIRAGIWHQPMFSVEDQASFLTKQGKVHACVVMDSLEEFGKVMKVPLKPELATK